MGPCFKLKLTSPLFLKCSVFVLPSACVLKTAYPLERALEYCKHKCPHKYINQRPTLKYDNGSRLCLKIIFFLPLISHSSHKASQRPHTHTHAHTHMHTHECMHTNTRDCFTTLVTNINSLLVFILFIFFTVNFFTYFLKYMYKYFSNLLKLIFSHTHSDKRGEGRLESHKTTTDRSPSDTEPQAGG